MTTTAMQTTKFRQVSDSVWTFSRPFLRSGLFKFGGRATAVRFTNGDIFLVSPTEPDDTTKATLDKLGNVKYIVAPDDEVYLGCALVTVASFVLEAIQGDVS